MTLPGPSVSLPPAASGPPSPLREERCWRAGPIWFFDTRAEPIDPPTVYSKLVAAASKKVWIWDPYFNTGDEAAIASIQPAASFRLLLEGSCNPNGALRARVAAFKTLFPARYPGVTFQIRCFDRDVYTDSALCPHDRFLIVDQHVYVVGTSLTAHWKRDHPTVLVQVTDSDAINLVEKQFDQYWSDAKHTKEL